MKSRNFCVSCGLLILTRLLAHASPAAEPAGPIPGIGPVGEIVKVQGDFQFTEGPGDDGQGNLYFTDIPANRIHQLDVFSGKPR
jgi:hypothetical protein